MTKPTVLTFHEIFASASCFFLSLFLHSKIAVSASGTARLNPKEFNFYYYQFRVGAGIVIKNPFQKK